MLGLPFPAGRYVDELAQRGKTAAVKPSVINGQASFSGFENMAQKLLKEGRPKEDIARFCLDAVGDTLSAMLEAAVPKEDNSPVVFMGGVMASRVLRERFHKDGRAVFALPSLSSDNAAGIAVFSYLFNG
ncbi:tRNA N6-adenosine threonylcarbamoyltransferase [bioreactor metagenome]|uniref:tRNA N6-adenosine threonylcarbamoyltransferase n=1 Tax=bioreactor metagenome TaxID=1076179 RepID=A0A645H9C9_9ZZZZ